MVKVIIQKKNGEVLEFDDVVNIRIPGSDGIVIEKEPNNSFIIEDSESLNSYYQGVFDALKIKDDIVKIEYEPGKRGNNLKFYTIYGNIISMTAYWDYGVQRYIPDEVLKNHITASCMYNIIEEGLFPITSYNMLITRAEGFFVYVPETRRIEHFNLLSGYSEDMSHVIDICHNFTMEFEDFGKYRDYIDFKTPYDLELDGRNLLLLRAGFLKNEDSIFNFVLNLEPGNPLGIKKIRLTDDRVEFVNEEKFFEIPE